MNQQDSLDYLKKMLRSVVCYTLWELSILYGKYMWHIVGKITVSGTIKMLIIYIILWATQRIRARFRILNVLFNIQIVILKLATLTLEAHFWSLISRRIIALFDKVIFILYATIKYGEMKLVQKLCENVRYEQIVLQTLLRRNE